MSDSNPQNALFTIPTIIFSPVWQRAKFCALTPSFAGTHSASMSVSSWSSWSSWSS